MGCGCNKKAPGTKCNKCAPESSSTSTCTKCKSSSDDCKCKSSSSSSTPECKDVGCQKICFGHWGPPCCSKCKKLPEYDICDFSNIPSGSLWFGFKLDPFGAVRSLTSGECYNQVGVILQIKEKRVVFESKKDSCGCLQKKCKKCYVKHPVVFSVWYNGCVQTIPLIDLAKNPLIRRQAVRPVKPTVNKCTDHKRLKQLWCVMQEFLNGGYRFEQSGSANMRGLFNLDVLNPNFDSYSDTKLVYTTLFKNATLNNRGCCEKEAPCCSTDLTAGGSERLSCESKPYDEKCCASSSECSKCSVDCFQASQATIQDFLYDDGQKGCLDLRWFSGLVPVWTECGCDCLYKKIETAFTEQGPCLLKDLQEIVQCWASGRDLPCTKSCRGSSKKDCPCYPADCDVEKAIQGVDVLYTLLSGVNYANLPTPLPTALNGNDLTFNLNQIKQVLQGVLCQRLDPFQITSTYTYGPLTVAYTAETTPFNADCNGLASSINDRYGH